MALWASACHFAKTLDPFCRDNNLEVDQRRDAQPVAWFLRSLVESIIAVSIAVRGDWRRLRIFAHLGVSMAGLACSLPERVDG